MVIDLIVGMPEVSESIFVVRDICMDQEQREEFARLLTLHRRQIFGYIYTLVHQLNDADDIYQQTSVALWQKFGDFQPGTNFGTWACTFARYKVLEFNKKRGNTIFLSEALQQEVADVADQIEPDHWDRRSEALRDCLEKLPESQVNLVQSCFSDSSSVKQVAQQLSRSIHSIHSSLRNIRMKLLECVERRMASA